MSQLLMFVLGGACGLVAGYTIPGVYRVVKAYLAAKKAAAEAKVKAALDAISKKV